ncbi:SHOCT domain-containing protein [bacterium]|jgi:hypothetical protein|nr:SHOCT domain-containing protein [bacterium]
MMEASLLAEIPARAVPVDAWRNLAIPLGVGSLALMAVGAVWWWFSRSSDEPSINSSDLLEEFRQMLDAGTITPAEFERVRMKLGNRIRQEQGQRPAAEKTLAPLPAEEGDFEWEEIDLSHLPKDPLNPSKPISDTENNDSPPG